MTQFNERPLDFVLVLFSCLYNEKTMESLENNKDFLRSINTPDISGFSGRAVILFKSIMKF